MYVIIVCQQIAEPQWFEWNHSDWIGCVETIESAV